MSDSSRRNFYISNNTDKYIEKYKEDNKLPNRSKALENIILEHKINSNLSSEKVYHAIADRLSESISDLLSGDLNKIKNSSNSADINSQLMIEMFNSYIYNTTEDNFKNISTDKHKTQLLDNAEEAVENRILRNITKKSYGKF